MSEGKPKTQPVAQAGSPGKAAVVGLEVGGVHSNDSHLRLPPRDATCPHARQRSEEAGNGSQEIIIPEKLRQLQHALYRKAKARAECSAMKRLGKPDTVNPSVRFDEGSESDGHWRKPFIPSAPAYSTTGFVTQADNREPYISLAKLWVMTMPLRRHYSGQCFLEAANKWKSSK